MDVRGFKIWGLGNEEIGAGPMAPVLTPWSMALFMMNVCRSRSIVLDEIWVCLC